MTAPTVPLRRVARVVNGGTPKPEPDMWDGPIPWATPIDLARVDGGIVSETDRTLTREGLNQGSKHVPAQSVLLSTRAPIGYVARTVGKMAFNQGCKAVVPYADLDVRCLAYWLWASRDRLQALGSGSTFMELGNEPLLGFPVPQLPVEEQRRIADFLDDQVTRIDNIIAARQAQTLRLAERQAAIIDGWVEEDGDRFGWIALRRWIVGIEQGWSPQCSNVAAASDEFGVLKLSAVRDGVFDARENKAMLPGEEPDYRYSLRAGDLLVSRANTPELVGDSAVVDVDRANLFLCDLIYRVRIDHVQTGYVCLGLRSRRVRGLLRVLARGTSLSMAKIRGEDIRNLPMPAAPESRRRARQLEIESFEREQATARTALQRSVAGFMELKRSLISAAVSGEFDVSTASGREVPA